MSFDLAAIRDDLQQAPPASPYPVELAVAIVSDVFRTGGVHPVPPAAWWAERTSKHALVKEQVGMLAHLLAYTRLRASTVEALTAQPVEAMPALDEFLDSIEPLTAEMVRANTFRQEEFLRKWVQAVRGSITGESAADSHRKRKALDYRATLAEYERAEKARVKEAAQRQKMLQEAAAREAAARGWRE